MTRVLFATLALAGLALAPAAGAGIIRGTIRTPSAGGTAAVSANAYPGRASSLPGARGASHGQAADAVVYVDHVPASAESALARATEPGIEPVPQLSQQNQAFVPRVLAVAVGAAVDFPNRDPIFHNVFSFSPAKRFDLGKYPRGGSKKVVFNKPGLVNVYCDIHSDMAAFVLVLPHHGFARPRASGEYRLPPLPAGRYQLNVWHPDLGERSEAVVVPESGEIAVDLSFR